MPHQGPPLRGHLGPLGRGNARIVFRVRVGRDPHERAGEKGIRGYYRVLPLKLEGDYVTRWPSHPTSPLLEVLVLD